MTHQQARLYAFIQAQMNISEVSPSYEEMSAHMGTGSKSQIYNMVVALRDAGHITFRANRARSIRLTAKPNPAPYGIREALKRIMSTTSLDDAQRVAGWALNEIDRGAS